MSAPGLSTTSAREAAKGGGFEKEESLALTFAQREPRVGAFHHGYYAEVGVGRPPSIPDAIHYYTLAAQAGNADV